MRLTYFGHSCFLLEAVGVRLVIDPFLSENPHGSIDPATVPCDYALCTHAHCDHVGDAARLARLHGATIVAPYELAVHLSTDGSKIIDLNPGGGVNLPWGRIAMTPALHSSSLDYESGTTEAMGTPSGYVITVEGRSIYHAGDTALFGDMRLIGRRGLDVALLPIGDYYTMGIEDAVDALDLLLPKLTIPMHYNTFEKIRVDPNEFARKASASGHKVKVMSPGESLDL